jgi:hypothetical protein
MAPHNSQAGQLPATPYDPAYDTLRFDILVVLALIRATDVCHRCMHTTLATATRAFEALLTAPSQYPNRGSQIQHVNTDAATGAILSFTTTATPTPVTLRTALLTRNLLSPTATASLIDRILSPLSFPSDDAPNLSQTQLWFSLGGRYTLLDAIHHRPLADFARTHMQHLNNICRGRLGHHANMASICPLGPASSCFGLPMASGYPYPDKPGRQGEVALRHAVGFLDVAVEEVVEEQLLHRREWPAAVRDREHPDLEVLAAVEGLPAFRARLEALRWRDKYRRLEGEVEVVKREWRDRGWVEGEGEGMEVEDVEETRDMLLELVQQIMAKMG